jgi:HEAT repeat protein
MLLAIGVAACSSDSARDTRVSRDLAHLLGWVDIEQVLGHTNHDVRLRGVRALADINDEIVVPFLVNALSDQDLRVRRDAARALGARGQRAQEAVPALGEALNDPSAIVRSSALRSLGEIGGQDAAQTLIRHLQSVDSAHHEAVLLSLGTTGHPAAVNEIAAHLSSSDPFVRRAATVALVRVGEASAGVLRERLDDPRVSLRCEAARALALTGNESDIARLRDLASDDASPLVRTCALGAGGRLGDLDAVPALARELREGTTEARAFAADALALIGTPDVVGPLANALTAFPVERDHPNPALRALIGLGTIARPELLSRLETATTEEQVLFGRALASIGVEADIVEINAALGRAQHDDARSALRDAIASIEYREAREAR